VGAPIPSLLVPKIRYRPWVFGYLGSTPIGSQTRSSMVEHPRPFLLVPKNSFREPHGLGYQTFRKIPDRFLPTDKF
jgi:hypothetical protein